MLVAQVSEANRTRLGRKKTKKKKLSKRRTFQRPSRALAIRFKDFSYNDLSHFMHVFTLFPPPPPQSPVCGMLEHVEQLDLQEVEGPICGI